MFQLRQGLGERIFQHHERFARRDTGEDVAQGEVVGSKNVFGEEDAQLPVDLDGALDHGHAFNLNARRFFTSINLHLPGRFGGNSHAIK